MTFHSVAEIFDSIDETRRSLVTRLSGLSEEESNRRQSPDGWTVAEIAEHLSIIEQRLTGLMQMMLKKTEDAGGARGGAPFAPVSIEQFVERSRTEKYQAPEMALPQGSVALSESLARLERSRAELRGLRARIEAVDATAARYSHPAFGPLDLYQWLAFIGAHEQRHLKQIETLLQSGETGRATGAPQ